MAIKFKNYFATSEKAEQKNIIEFLRMKNFYVYKNNNVGIYKKATDSYIPAQTKGIPDLTAIKSGRVYQIEVKSSRGRLSEYQKEFMKEWTDRGGTYIFGDFDEVAKQINKYDK